jgi:hypothetical protein
VTPTENESQITFGRTKLLFLTDIYNTRISFPNVPILLATADIKACFRYARIHADLTGACGFAAGGYYRLAWAHAKTEAVSYFFDFALRYHINYSTNSIILLHRWIALFISFLMVSWSMCCFNI